MYYTCNKWAGYVHACMPVTYYVKHVYNITCVKHVFYKCVSHEIINAIYMCNPNISHIYVVW